ncbi:MAG: hypothetical protein JSR65_13885 [Proteobacteria bacterium]|nr:hypothetical protein [Pseudomonadota bacterium]
MDNDFQWRSQMRKLGEGIEPTHDLWPAIAARLVLPASSRRQWHRPALALAASLLVGLGAMTYSLNRSIDLPSGNIVGSHGSATQTVGVQTALDWATPADPGLAAAAQDLDKASADLQAALEARPDAVFLVGLLNRTNAQRMRLVRQSAISG